MFNSLCGEEGDDDSLEILIHLNLIRSKLSAWFDHLPKKDIKGPDLI